MEKEFCKKWWQNSKSLALSILFDHLLNKGLCAPFFSFLYVIPSRECQAHFKVLYNAYNKSLKIDILYNTEIFLLMTFTLLKPPIPSPLT